MTSIFEHFAFANPWWLLGLLLIPPLLFLRNARGAGSGIDFSSLSILASVGTPPRERMGSFTPLLLSLALLCGVLALARPQWQNSYTARNASGVDILITLDVSQSMDTADYSEDNRSRSFRYQVKRIDAAKRVITGFVEQRPDDRIGMVAFGVRPYSVSPLTLDHEWLLAAMQRLRLGDIESDGTAIGSALAAAATRLTERDSKSKVIVLVTDGASNSGKLSPLQSATFASTLGIRVYTVAIGTEHGRLSSTQTTMPQQEFDPETLARIARMTGGEFYHARTIAALEDTFDTINELEKTEAQRNTYVDAKEFFPWCILASFLLAFLALSAFALNPPPVP